MNIIGKKLLNYFIKGLLVVVPITISIFIVKWAITTVNDWLNINNIFGVNSLTGKNVNIPGLGLILVLIIVIITGIFATNFVTESMHSWFRQILNRLPILNFIYSSIKDLTEAFVGDDKKFNFPVLVETEGDMKKIGFLTQNDLSSLDLSDEAIVYFPFSYSFAGQIYVVKKEKIKPLNISASEAMKLVISGGVAHL